MRLLGIIAEYDPFHLGHAYQLAKARERAGADAVVVVMSGCFTQRGEAALLSPAVRARMALLGGADVVLALPAMWSLRDAEHFALGGVHLLSSIGCSALSFGAEDDSLSDLQRLAEVMENPPPMMLYAIHSRLDAGMSYPAALHKTLELLMPESAALLSSPNNTLAVCYLRAMLRLGARMDLYPIRRTGSYHDTAMRGALSSASAIRAAALCGQWEQVQSAMPPYVFSLLRSEAAQGRMMRPDALDQALCYRLRSMSAEEWHSLPGASEGIEDRLRKAAQTEVSRAALLEKAKTKRYPYARLSRMCAHALLRMDDALLEETALPPAAWLLGFRADAQGALRAIKQSGFPLISKAADYDRGEKWFQKELFAYDLWSMGTGLPTGLALTQGVVRL